MSTFQYTSLNISSSSNDNSIPFPRFYYTLTSFFNDEFSAFLFGGTNSDNLFDNKLYKLSIPVDKTSTDYQWSIVDDGSNVNSPVARQGHNAAVDSNNMFWIVGNVYSLHICCSSIFHFHFVCLFCFVL